MSFLSKDTDNFIINGDMRVSQRGDFSADSNAVNTTYYIDRWKSFVSAVTANKRHYDTNQPPSLNGSKSLRMTCAVGATGGMGAEQPIEDYSLFENKTITVSAMVKSNSPNARIIITQNGISNTTGIPHTGDGTWQKIYTTLKLSSGFTGLKMDIAIIGVNATSVAISQYDYIEFTGAKLEFGSRPTPFKPRPLATEEALCQRYYETCTFTGGVAHNNTGFTQFGGAYKVSKRATPTFQYPCTIQFPNYTAAVRNDSVGSTGENDRHRCGGYYYKTVSEWASTACKCNVYISVDCEM